MLIGIDSAVARLRGSADAERRTARQMWQTLRSQGSRSAVEVMLEDAEAALGPNAPPGFLQALSVQRGDHILAGLYAAARQTKLPLPLHNQRLAAAPDYRARPEPFNLPIAGNWKLTEAAHRL